MDLNELIDRVYQILNDHNPDRPAVVEINGSLRAISGVDMDEHGNFVIHLQDEPKPEPEQDEFFKKHGRHARHIVLHNEEPEQAKHEEPIRRSFFDEDDRALALDDDE